MMRFNKISPSMSDIILSMKGYLGKVINMKKILA